MEIKVNEKEIYKISVKYNKKPEYIGAAPQGNILYLTYYKIEQNNGYNVLKCNAYNNNSFKYQLDKNKRFNQKLINKYKQIFNKNKELIKQYAINKEFQNIINLIKVV